MIELKPYSKEFYYDQTKKLKVVTIPCRSDNYTYLVLSEDEKEAVLIDCADHIKTLKVLFDLKLTLKSIFLTHHHFDHVDGIDKILEVHSDATLYCSQKEQDRKVFSSTAKIVFDGAQINTFGETVKVLSTPGHTSSLTSYYFQSSDALFCGDHVFSLGCGRVFEDYPGVYDDFYSSIEKVKTNTTNETLVFCAHEYTQKNLAFHKSINQLQIDTISELQSRIEKLDGERSIPTDMEFEKKHNVFLNSNKEDFKKTRTLKDNF